MEQEEFTLLLDRWADGSKDALDALAPVVYRELHRLARAHFARERPDHTLQPTALINEAYLKLVRQDRRQWKNRAHFFASASQVMREILISHARKVHAVKRGSGEKIPLDDVLTFSPENGTLLTALDDALRELAAFDERKSRIIEMRFFAGLTSEEIAEALGISVPTVTRDLRVAEAWLKSHLS